jgi:hypothetical protein
MTILGHLGGALILGNSVSMIFPRPSRKETLTLFLLAVIFATLPDADVIYYVLKNLSFHIGDDFKHHLWISHSPLFYLSSFILIYSAGLVFLRKSYSWALPWIFILGVTVHFVLDSILSVDGIRWLWPLSDSQWIVHPIASRHGSDFGSKLLKSPYFLYEIVIFEISTILILRRLFPRLKVTLYWLKVVLFLGSIDIVLYYVLYRQWSNWTQAVTQIFSALYSHIFLPYSAMLLVTGGVCALIYTAVKKVKISLRPYRYSVILWYSLASVSLMLTYCLVGLLNFGMEADILILAIATICVPYIWSASFSGHVGSFCGMYAGVGLLVYCILFSSIGFWWDNLWVFGLLNFAGYVGGWMGTWVTTGQIRDSVSFNSVRLDSLGEFGKSPLIEDTIRRACLKVLRDFDQTKIPIYRLMTEESLFLKDSTGKGKILDLHKEFMAYIVVRPHVDYMVRFLHGRHDFANVDEVFDTAGNFSRFVRLRVRLFSKSTGHLGGFHVLIMCYKETAEVIWADDETIAIIANFANEIIRAVPPLGGKAILAFDKPVSLCHQMKMRFRQKFEEHKKGIGDRGEQLIYERGGGRQFADEVRSIFFFKTFFDKIRGGLTPILTFIFLNVGLALILKRLLRLIGLGE